MGIFFGNVVHVKAASSLLFDEWRTSGNNGSLKLNYAQKRNELHRLSAFKPEIFFDFLFPHSHLSPQDFQLVSSFVDDGDAMVESLQRT